MTLWAALRARPDELKPVLARAARNSDSQPQRRWEHCRVGWPSPWCSHWASRGSPHASSALAVPLWWRARRRCELDEASQRQLALVELAMRRSDERRVGRVLSARDDPRSAAGPIWVEPHQIGPVPGETGHAVRHATPGVDEMGPRRQHRSDLAHGALALFGRGRRDYHGQGPLREHCLARERLPLHEMRDDPEKCEKLGRHDPRTLRAAPRTRQPQRTGPSPGIAPASNGAPVHIRRGWRPASSRGGESWSRAASTCLPPNLPFSGGNLIPISPQRKRARVSSQREVQALATTRADPVRMSGGGARRQQPVRRRPSSGVKSEDPRTRGRNC